MLLLLPLVALGAATAVGYTRIPPSDLSKIIVDYLEESGINLARIAAGMELPYIPANLREDPEFDLNDIRNECFYRIRVMERGPWSFRDHPILGRFSYIPPGTFVMGSPENELGRYQDETQHEVTLTRGFWIMQTEVTQRAWTQVMGANPSRFQQGPEAQERPVERVSWNDCQSFIRTLQERRSGQFHLPTEARWEYAARAGENFVYAGSNDIDEVAWYSRNSGVTTHLVGQKKPNAWGLYDMSGNVWEWCQDWYGAYPLDSIVDPVGPQSGSSRVNRGGSWVNDPRIARAAYRDGSDPGGRVGDLGFRLLREDT